MTTKTQQKGRIYIVRDASDSSVRLIEAGTPAQALRHVANARYTVAAAKVPDVAFHMARGVTVEKAGDAE